MFTGWFQVQRKDEPEPTHFHTIREVLDAQCRYFLTMTSVSGFYINDEKFNDDSKENAGKLLLSDEVTVLPGEVLRVGQLVTRSTQSVGDGGVVKASFMKCRDLKNNVLALSVVCPGHFYSVPDAPSKATKRTDVYQIWSVLDLYKTFPITVQLIVGWIPKPQPSQHFTGLLSLTHKTRPDSIIFHSFSKEGLIFVELPLDADVKIKTAINQSDLEWTDPYKEALQACQRHVFEFVIWNEIAHTPIS